MSFKDIGTAFLTGFLTQKGKQLTSANEKAEKYYDLQLQLAEKNKGKYQSRVGVANNLVSVANEIKSLYGTDDQIKAAVAQGPNELNKLLQRMKAAKAAAGPAIWNERYVRDIYAELPENVVSSPEWLKYSNMSTTDYIMETMGIKKYEIGDYKSPDSSFWDKLSGKNKMARTRAELDEMDFYEGMSVYDINQSANEAEYNSLLPGAFLEYTTDKFITQDVRNTFADQIRDDVRDIKMREDYKTTVDILEDSRSALLSESGFISTVVNNTKDKATGTEIADFSNLKRGDQITFETHALPGITQEQWNIWIKDNAAINAYIAQVNSIEQNEEALKAPIRNAINSRLDIAAITYGDVFSEDEGIKSSVNLYLPDEKVGTGISDTKEDPIGKEAIDSIEDEVIIKDVSIDMGEAFSNINRTTPLSEDGSVWAFKNSEGVDFKIMNANTNNPLIIRQDNCVEVRGNNAKLFLDRLGLGTTLILGKEKQKKQLAKSLLETDIGKEFIEKYKTSNEKKVSRTSNNTLLSVFKKMYGKDIPQEMESILIKTIREAIK